MKWDAILEHCSFDYMKQHATKAFHSAVLFGTAALRRLSIRAQRSMARRVDGRGKV